VTMTTFVLGFLLVLQPSAAPLPAGSPGYPQYPGPDAGKVSAGTQSRDRSSWGATSPEQRSRWSSSTGIADSTPAASPRLAAPPPKMERAATPMPSVGGEFAASTGPHRLTPPELVEQALALPSTSTLQGKPLALVTAVRTAAEQHERFEIIHAYWRLAEAVADYHFQLEFAEQLSRLQTTGGHGWELRAAIAAAAASLKEAEADAMAAQHQLAALTPETSSKMLPLPMDRPHVGPYRTYYAELFASRPGAERALQIDRTLPLRTKAIDDRARAVAAAEEGFSAAMEPQNRGEGRTSAAVEAAEQTLRQRRALMATICRYNHEIADYVAAAASPMATAETVVGMLIKQAHEMPRTVAGEEPKAVTPASFSEPVDKPAADGTVSLLHHQAAPVVRPTEATAAPAPLVLPSPEAAPAPTVAAPPAYDVPPAANSMPAARRNQPTRAVRPKASDTPSNAGSNTP
jgi:hypothetical protein